MSDNKKNNIVTEKSEYDNFIGKTSTLETPGVLPVDITTDTNLNERTNHWVGMPEFEQENNPAYKTIYLHFRNQEDYEEFSKKYTKEVDSEQFFSKKTKSIWYPHLDKDANTLKRWME